MPAERGLYAAALPPIAAALLASSPYLQTGPVALTGLLTFGALTALATPGSDEYVALGLGLAAIVGVVRLGLGLLRGGALAYLLSQPMLMGFVPAAGILIIASQLPSLFGASPPEDGLLRAAGWTLAHPSDWQPSAILLALVVLALMAGGRLTLPLFPAVPLAVLLAIGYSELVGYDGATVGDISVGAPPFSLHLPWAELDELLVSGVVIAVVGFAEPAAIARTFAARDRRRWDPNRELASQGAANVAASLTGGFPVGGSFSRTSLNRLAGARSRWSGAVTGLAVLAFLPLAGVLSPLPTAVLAAIVVGAVAGLVRLRPLVRLWRYSRRQAGVAWATFGLTLGLAPRLERAVIAGVVLAVAVHLWRELHVHVGASTEGDTLHLRPQGVLWFGVAPRLEQAFLNTLASHPEARRVVIDLTGLGRIDTTGALSLRTVVEEARRTGLEVTLHGAQRQHRRLVRRIVESDENL